MKKQSGPMRCGYSVVLERVASAGILPRKQTARSVAGSGGRKERGEASFAPDTRVHGDFSWKVTEHVHFCFLDAPTISI